MIDLGKLKQLPSQLLSNQYIQNIGWLGFGELFGRLVRMGLVVVIARILTPHDYGLAAIIFTIKEFVIVFTLKGGITGKLVQTDEKDLEVLSNTAYWFSWLVCGALFLLQAIAAFPIAWFYKDNQLILPICLVALSYLALPTYAVQLALVTRENRLKILAIADTLIMVLSGLVTLGLALLGCGLWSLILPYVFINGGVYFTILRGNHTWRPSEKFTLHRWREIFDFAKNVIGSHLMDKVRSNIDYLLVGGVLGVEALGLYYFAYNAGIGIVLNVIYKMANAQLPYICAARSNFDEFKKRYFSSLKAAFLAITVLVGLQAGLAPFYVPIVFGEKWLPAIPIFILVCLSAIPRTIGYSASGLLQAIDRPDLDFKWNIIFTGVFCVALLLVVNQGLIPVATAVLLSHFIAIPIFCVWATRFVFNTSKQSHLAAVPEK
ncbi:MAG: lipopolysaccharide biosynthesis protein [Cyanobacteria bacterium P01_A01_bin.116]